MIIILYDFAIKCCKEANEFLHKKDYINKGRKIYKAQDAITELMCSLNMDKGGQISTNLYRLYEYMNWRLSQANIKKDEKIIDEVLTHLLSLREAWLTAIENVRRLEIGNKSMEKKYQGDSVHLVG